MKTDEREIANRIADYWYKELHGKVAPIYAKQKLAELIVIEV